jgi:two-component system, OmpR family, response regulator
MEVRVFLVEDLRSIRSLLDELFDSIGGVRLVGTAITEAEASLWLEDNAGGWDLAIIDLVLEQGSGTGVIRRARQSAPHGTIAVFSSYATPVMRDHCMKLGANVVFDKGDTAAFVTWLDGHVHPRGSERRP